MCKWRVSQLGDSVIGPSQLDFRHSRPVDAQANLKATICQMGGRILAGHMGIAHMTPISDEWIQVPNARVENLVGEIHTTRDTASVGLDRSPFEFKVVVSGSIYEVVGTTPIGADI